jgi:hypothetical protein
MTKRETEREEQHMLFLVESAQRAGYSEREIVEIVHDAVETDADVERAA